MAKIKKKSAKKVSPKKRTKKKAAVLRSPKKRTKKKNDGISSEIIFDSQVGDTGALFVSTPEDPAIEEALKEFDDINKKPTEIKKEPVKENDLSGFNMAPSQPVQANNFIKPADNNNSFSFEKIISWITSKFKKS